MDLNWLEWMWIGVFLSLSVVLFYMHWFLAEVEREPLSALFLFAWATLVMPLVVLKVRVHEVHAQLLTLLPAEPADVSNFTAWAAIVVAWAVLAILWVGAHAILFGWLKKCWITRACDRRQREYEEGKQSG